ncbi:pyridoxal phosphate phosphatase PHOSPHO2-like isoform X3 [Tachypleus tridentatus]|uniref:pyridoxal phosphate phosphatase PHOSPHO2-like isoform X3 n=1 Tax=Tachypleus tridentatus TaxID=6853 RepID=UPI003FD5BDF6
MTYVVSSMEGKELVALDFDHTIIDANSDTYIAKLAPGGMIPEEIEALHKPDGWTKYMQQVFLFLYQNEVQPQNVLDCLSEISFTPGMRELLLLLSSSNRFEIIIISDSNSMFIDHILKVGQVAHTVSEVFTNPAYFDQSGRLHVKEFHVQDRCTLSSKNLCKGEILQLYIKKRSSEGIQFCRTAFIGDGNHDFCPCLQLSVNDLIFPRIGFSLCRKLSRNPEMIKAKIYPWASGFDIKDVLF